MHTRLETAAFSLPHTPTLLQKTLKKQTHPPNFQSMLLKPCPLLSSESHTISLVSLVFLKVDLGGPKPISVDTPLTIQKHHQVLRF